MSKCRPIDRDLDFLLPPSVQEWLPEGHLARYVVEVVEGLDLRDLERAYAGKEHGLHTVAGEFLSQQHLIAHLCQPCPTCRVFSMSWSVLAA